MIELAVCRSREGNIERTHNDISELLGLLMYEQQTKKKKSDYLRLNGVKGKKSHTFNKMTTARRQEQERGKRVATGVEKS